MDFAPVLAEVEQVEAKAGVAPVLAAIQQHKTLVGSAPVIISLVFEVAAQKQSSHCTQLLHWQSPLVVLFVHEAEGLAARGEIVWVGCSS